MKRVFISLFLIFFTLLFAVAEEVCGDNVMRFYRMAVPVTHSAYEEDFDEQYERVIDFWRSTEEFMNRVFVPLGYCFDIIEDERLVMSKRNSIDDDYYSAVSYGTELLNAAVGASFYDIGMWVTHRPLGSENTGLSVVGGAFNIGTRASGYAESDPWVVAHEIAHLLGADHTTDGSLMDVGGNFLSVESIKKIRRATLDNNSSYYSDEARTQLVGANGGGYYVYGEKVQNSAPRFNEKAMKSSYRVPQGACLSIEAFVVDDENDRIAYAVDSEYFAILAPSVNSIVDYRPRYSADIFYDDYFYPVSGTDIPSMSPGKYSLKIVANDLPKNDDYSYLLLKESPFYSLYAQWLADVQIVAGEPFNVGIVAERTAYSPGEEITLRWGVNSNYFTSDSRLRVMLSDDYGESFKYLLADSVPALDGECKVSLPDLYIGEKSVDFITAQRVMRAGIIRLEEIGGAAYTLTCLTPENGGGFTLDGTYIAPDPEPEPPAPEPEIPAPEPEIPQPEPEIPEQPEITTSVGGVRLSQRATVYDICGRVVARSLDESLSLPAGLYIVDGKKVIVK